MFHIPPGSPRPMWRGGIEMMNLPDFARYYQIVRFDVGDPSGDPALLWVRREDSRIGIKRMATEITVYRIFACGRRIRHGRRSRRYRPPGGVDAAFDNRWHRGNSTG